MAFPKIHHCLVCEDLREERNRKISILGFYGTTPNVDIIVTELNKPIPRVAFLLLGEKGEGEFEASIELLSPDGKPLVLAKLGKVEILQATRRYSYGMGLQQLVFPQDGTYTLKFLIDGKDHYETTFNVRLGVSADFDK